MDRAALDLALELGVPCGGWCPKGRLAEDGPISRQYPLLETESEDYAIRTLLNVRDSDGTLALTWGRPTGGTAYTIEVARQNHKPVFVSDLSVKQDPIGVVLWVRTTRIHVLNVAGPRESSAPGIQEPAREFLEMVFREIFDPA